MLLFNSIGNIGGSKGGLNHGGSIDPEQYIDDMRFPFVGRNIDTSSGRIEYNYFNGAIQFNNVDPSALNELVYEFDVHIYLKDNI